MTNDKREELSRYAHEAWSGWMQHLFDKSQSNEDYSVTIPANLVYRWKRQLNTLYEGLSENEKDSDRKEADRILEICEKPKKEREFMIGQRVILTGVGGEKEIGTVVVPETKTTRGVWVFSPSRQYASDYDKSNVEFLPNGQL